MSTLKAIRGTRDLLPPETEIWNHIEATARRVFALYSFGEFRTPIFVDTQLFSRGVGEETDIVSKEMYTWEDGERFDEKKMAAAWLEKNEMELNAIYNSGSPLFLPKLRALGVHLQIYRRASNRAEIVSFRPAISAEAVDNLHKAQALTKSDPKSQMQHLHVHLRLVVPTSASANLWVSRRDVTVERFEGDFFANPQSLTLRPENTAGVVRAYIEHKLGETGQLQKLYYIGPQFRRERPQKGRYRQFYQIGAEVIGPPSAGSESPLRDAEVLEMLATFLNQLGITGWKLKINSVGSAEDRTRYVEKLREALRPVVAGMCEDCQRRAVTNPLRVLDCKVPEDQPTIAQLPRIWDSLDPASRDHFAAVCAALDASGVPYEQDYRLVRGLDYYTRTTFEFVQESGLGAQNALLGGGRYDGLSEAIGGPKAPGIGFAVGEDRLVLALEGQAKQVSQLADAFVAPLGEALNAQALALAKELRAQGLCIELGDGSFRLKKSLEAGNKVARAIVILGEDELASGILTVKNFATGQQLKVPRGQLGQQLGDLITNS